LENYSINKLATSNSTSLAINGDGELYTWGSSSEGQGGRDATASVCVPTQVGSATNWSTCAGGYATWATNALGELWFIGGDGYYGQNGQGTTTDYSEPIQIGTETYWVSVHGTHRGAMGITNHGSADDGRLYYWGLNHNGQAGQGNTDPTTYRSPIQIGTDTTWKSSCLVADWSAALKSDGTMWAWGQNSVGQLGQGNTTSYSSPVQVGSDDDWAIMTIDWRDSLYAIKTGGTLWCCGHNNYGQLGQGDTTDRSTLVQVGSLEDWKLITTGDGSAISMKTDNTLWAWGSGRYGCIGQGTTTDYSSPIQVGGATDWLSVGTEGQGHHVQAIRSA
jgi:alpha-tubulin suppressor-like RCC1 family protein